MSLAESSQEHTRSKEKENERGVGGGIEVKVREEVPFCRMSEDDDDFNVGCDPTYEVGICEERFEPATVFRESPPIIIVPQS